MRSHLALKRLSAYLDDELPDREQRLVEAHVSQCNACKSRLHGLRLVVSELQRVPAVEAPPSLARSIETEAAMRWGPYPPPGGRLLGRRG
ncbi:MAG TPA: zf-HC2 domain-containing protein, partial [Thermoanaerobaculia bacterium]|nr:zf-HC2 domain-containing protein [Thermoanaerobaculia bacterium]